MFDTLFGAEMPLAVRFFLAFLIVLGLIGATAWAVRRFGAGRLGAATRGRQPRLAVVDYASVDGRRRLILVRRDNVEHLMMIGGPTDVVVEPNIVRATAAPRDMPGTRPTAGIDALPRAIPLPENGNGSAWPLAPEPTVGLRPSPRLEPLPDEMPAQPFRPLEPPPRPQRDTLAALADELSTRPAPTPPRKPVETRQEMRRPITPPAPPAPAGTRRRYGGRSKPGRHGAAPRSRFAQARRNPSARDTAARAGRDQLPPPPPPPPPRPVAKPVARAEVKPNPGNTGKTSALRFTRTGDGELVGPSDQDLTLASGGRRVWLVTGAASVAALIVSATPLAAQDISINFGGGAAGAAGAAGGLNERIIQLIALLTVLSLAPSILVMMTSFTRIVVVLSLLRTALGTATAPPNSVVISLALFLTAFVMGPVLTNVYDTGIKPLVANEITVDEAFNRASVPLRGFMEKNVRDKDLQLFMDMSGEKPPDKPEDLSMRILVPAFMISELKRAFEIGFLLFLPFLIIDLVVASVLMSMGMMMLPPVVVSLPFKLIFFVLVDGWTLVAGSLIQSYGT